MKLRLIEILLTIVLMILLVLGLTILDSKILILEERIIILEKTAETTVEIHVERAFDADMGVYDYQLVGKSGKATPIKRGRKRMSQLRENY